MTALLTRELALTAAPVLDAFHQACVDEGMLKRPHLALVVLDPTKRCPHDATYEDFKQAILFERTFGDEEAFENDYMAIAHSKAFISWRTGLPTRVVRETMAHLLLEGDTVYGGSVVIDGLIAAASGVDSWHDEMLAGTACMIVRGVANNTMQIQFIKNLEAGHFIKRPF